MNRLQYEISPYLLQHAETPADCRPWGAGAFGAARSEDKPVFLSIGYSACHWCRVMARESFASGEVAEALNRGFISVKADREERPDALAPFTAAYPLPAGGARYYLCRNGSCQRPVGPLEGWTR